jgi:hypothetical protein
MSDTPHPSHEHLANMAAGIVGALERSQLERHVATCGLCAANLRVLIDPSDAHVDGSSMPIDGAGVLRRARRLLSRRGPGPSAPATPTQFRAVLRFDSATMPPAYGMRGTPGESIRQFVFEAGPFEIELHTRPDRAGWVVSGQVLGPTEATAGEVRLFGQHQAARSSLSRLLEFTFPRVAPGQYRLELQLVPGALLQVESLQLGS